MEVAFYASSVVAVLATAMVITRLEPVHALLYLVVSLLSVAVAFFTLGAPFVAALEVIVYAGAIIVLFLFVVMMLNLGPQARRQEKSWLRPSAWVGPAILAGVLLALLVFFVRTPSGDTPGVSIGPKEIGAALFGPYLLAVELASFLLLAGLVAAYHVGRERREES